MGAAEKPIQFGFLPLKWEIEFNAGRIVPIAAFDRVLKSVEKSLHKDGFIYPPTIKKISKGFKGKTIRTILKPERSAHLYRVPASHELYLTLRKRENNIHEESAGLVIHYLAFMFNTRLQFSDWYFDGRIPIRRPGELVWDVLGTGKELSLVYSAWSKWPEPEQRRFITLLYMHSRASVYQWDWEEFTIRYMVLDSCWKMAVRLFGLKEPKKHADRISMLCRFLSVEPSHQFIDIEKMAKLRNDLFHEALWEGGRPGSNAFTDGGAYPIRMKNLAEQLILALIGKSRD